VAEPDLGELAREIIDNNLYLVLGTVSADGRPWASPVYYAAHRYTEFYWISSPDVTHSRNLAARPDVSLVVFDSRVAPGEGQAVYMSATAEELTGADLEQGVAVYPGPDRGGRAVSAADLRAPGPYRMYRATATEHSMLCPRESGPCAPHGLAYDHRTSVVMTPAI
jgi:hypothetical protein